MSPASFYFPKQYAMYVYAKALRHCGRVGMPRSRGNDC